MLFGCFHFEWKHLDSPEPSAIGHGKGKKPARIQWLFLVPLKGGMDYIIPQKAKYKWYILPIGGLYNPYHLLREPETTIDRMESPDGLVDF